MKFKFLLTFLLVISTFLFAADSWAKVISFTSCRYAHQEFDGNGNALTNRMNYANIKLPYGSTCPEPPLPAENHLLEPMSFVSRSGDVSIFTTVTRGDEDCIIDLMMIDFYEDNSL